MENLAVEAVNAIWWIVFVGIVGVGYHVYGRAVAEQWRMRRSLKKQGVKGPPPSLFNGNVSEMQRIQSEAKRYSGDNIISHDYSSSLFPYFEHWRKQYGLFFKSRIIILTQMHIRIVYSIVKKNKKTKPYIIILSTTENCFFFRIQFPIGTEVYFLNRNI